MQITFKLIAIFLIGLAIIATSCFVLLMKRSELSLNDTVFLITLLIFSVPAFFVIGLLFSPEGRYAVAFGYLFTVFVLVLASLVSVKKKRLELLMVALLLFVQILNREVDITRSAGPNWKSQVNQQTMECREKSRDYLEIIVLPTTPPWDKLPIKFRMKCDKVLNLS
jgi:hypothetical protein